MGGIGKTTVAQSLYVNGQVKGCYHDRIWVCVTEDFDVLKISKIIYEDLYEKKCKFDELNKVQEKLREKLSIKKFLLVLDDVWNEDYAKWVLLCAPFQGGTRGSTIIVTTRSHDVAKIMGSKEIYDLRELSDLDCLSLVAQHALQRPNFNEHPEFKEVGEVIAKRCKGLPLAAKSLGGLLRTKASLKQWIEVSTSKIWELQRNCIIPALRLSYHNLPPYLKPLFVYCSLFPKGHEFDKEELIMLWMAQGFLKRSGEHKQMEELGCEYFNELLSRSFFQQSTWNKSRFVMHDLNNDLAQFVAGSTYLRLDYKMASNEQYKVTDEARHASFITHEYADCRKFRAFSEAECLRTLLPIHEMFWSRSYLSIRVLNDMLPRLRCLRVLSFTWYYISELPNSIGNLKHLRYLKLSWTDIIELPQSICGLYNLQTLLLQGCSKLVRLPSGIQRLTHLRHLDVQSTPSLKEMPPGIGMLTCLHTLPKFIVDKSDGRKITELKNLHHLRETLSIIGMENVMNVQDAMDANLLGKKGVHELEMKWSSISGGSGLEFEVLDALRPQIGLESLGIEFYGGQSFPAWIGERLFCDMVKVRLVGCKKCADLPPLGQLTSLKELFIQGMDGVKIVGREFFGTCSPNAIGFRSLIKLSFMDMGSWEEWSVDSTNIAFPCLEELRICRCKKLNTVSLAKIPSLESLETSLPPTLVHLDITHCSNLKYMLLAIEMQSLTSLRRLKIIGCENLEDYPSGGRWPPNLDTLTMGEVKQPINVWGLATLPTSLRTLRFDGEFPQLISFTEVGTQLPTSLTRLQIMSLKNLESLGEGLENLSSLQHLSIYRCPKIQHLPETHLPTLSNLQIYKCPLLEERCKEEKKDYWPKISHIPYLRIYRELMGEL